MLTLPEHMTSPSMFSGFVWINFELLYARLKTGRIMWLGMADGGRRTSTQVSHNNFSSVYRIFTKLGHMIPLLKGKTPGH